MTMDMNITRTWHVTVERGDQDWPDVENAPGGRSLRPDRAVITFTDREGSPALRSVAVAGPFAQEDGGPGGLGDQYLWRPAADRDPDWPAWVDALVTGAMTRVDRDHELRTASAWWICTGQLARGGKKVLGPFGSRDLALEVRGHVEKATDTDGRYWVDDEPPVSSTPEEG